jgi:hypothetical protein
MADRSHNWFHLHPDDREAMLVLVRDLGHVPEDIAADFIVTGGGRTVRLLLTEHLRDAEGQLRLGADGELATREHAHDLAADRLPASIRP